MLVKSLTLIAALLIAPSALAASDLSTSISQSPSTALVYTTARFTVTVANIGNKSASNCSVAIALPRTNTSPQVYVLGTLIAKHASCTQSGTTLNCALGTINRNTSKQVWFDIQLPVSAAPLTTVATAATTSSQNSTANDAATNNASLSYYATTVGTTPTTPVTMVNNHCTGTGLVAWMECTFFPSSISSHDAVFHDDGTITIPIDPTYSGGWTVTSTANGNRLDFYYDDGGGTVATFIGWGADGSCFEGLTTFPGSSYVAPYEVCPL